MMSVMKNIWGYEFSKATQDLFAREVENFFIHHPEYNSYKEIADMVGIDPAWLSKLRNKTSTGEYGMKLKFHHLIKFCVKEVVDVHRLNLGQTQEEEWILLMCDTFKDEESLDVLKEAAKRGINVVELIKLAIAQKNDD
jgi:hypothetical protein